MESYSYEMFQINYRLEQSEDQLEARKYPQCWNVASILGMVVTNVEETKGYFIVTARKLEDDV